MPYARPTLAELHQRALQDIAGQSQGEGGLLRRSVLRVMASVMAGFAYLHYGYQDYIARQSVPWSAQDEAAAGWGALKGVHRKDATRAVGTRRFVATPGRAILSGTSIARSDGRLYAATADAVAGNDGVLTVPVAAAAPGADGNAAGDVVFYLVNAVEGVTSKSVAGSPMEGGADQEDPDDFKSRYLEAYAKPPEGGAQHDYIRWAKEVPGVTRAWCVPNGAGAGTVVVYVMLDDVRSTFDGFPQGTNGAAAAEKRAAPATGDQLLVADHIYPLRPVTALVYACAPVPDDVDFQLADLSPATPATLAAIRVALRDMFVRLGTAEGGAIYSSDWNEAIRSVAGLRHFSVVTPTAPIVTAPGHFPRLRTLTTAS